MQKKKNKKKRNCQLLTLSRFKVSTMEIVIKRDESEGHSGCS